MGLQLAGDDKLNFAGQLSLLENGPVMLDLAMHSIVRLGPMEILSYDNYDNLKEACQLNDDKRR